MLCDLFLKENRGNSYENESARQVVKALEKKKIPCRLIRLEGGCLQDYFLYAQHNKPSFTLSFVDLLGQEKPLCDHLQIPHFLWLTHSLASAAHYQNSSFGRVGLTDRSIKNPNIFFLPQGLPPRSASDNFLFDVVFFQPLIKRQSEERTWQELFGFEETSKLLKLIQLAQANRALSPWDFLKSSTSSLTWNDQIGILERYLYTERAIECISQTEGFSLHVFGEHVGDGWLPSLPKGVRLHTQLPHTEHLAVLKRSKIALFDHLESLDGVKYWLLPALQVGCLPLTNPTPYLEELLGKEAPIFYPSRDWKALGVKIREYLTHPKKRENAVEKMQEKLGIEQTWDNQVNKLIQLMK